MIQLGFYLLCFALIGQSLAIPAASSNQPKPEESKLKADAKELIKASASANDYTQLAADYAVEKQQSASSEPKPTGEYSPDAQPSYSQPLGNAGNEYSQPLNYPQPISYQNPGPQPQYAQEIPQGISAQAPPPPPPGAPGYEQPASAAAADAYSNGDQSGYADQPQYSQQYPAPQQYQAYQPAAQPVQYQQQNPSYQQQSPSYQPQGPSYQPQSPSYQSQGPSYQPAPAYQPAGSPYQAGPAVSSYQSGLQAYQVAPQQSPVINGYSQPLDLTYNSQPGYAPQPAVPAQAYSEVTYSQSSADYGQQNGYQHSSAHYAQPGEYSAQTPPQNEYQQPAKPKKTVILAIPVKLVSKNKYNNGQEGGYTAQEQPQYNQVQPAAAGVAVSHQNQEPQDNSGNAYYSTYAPQGGSSDGYKQDKPIYNEKNEEPRNQQHGSGDYNEQVDKEHGPKHHVQIVHNHIGGQSQGPKSYTNGKPGTLRSPPRGPPPKQYEAYEISGGAGGGGEEETVEYNGPTEHLNYVNAGAELEPNHLQTLTYLPGGVSAIGKPGKPSDLYEPANFAPFAAELAGFSGYGPSIHGPSIGGPINFNPHNPMELLYSPPNGFGKGPFGFGPAKPNPFGRPGPYGPPPSSPPYASSSTQSNSNSNYGQLLNSLLSVYSLGSSKGSNKPASGGGSKGISSYFNGLDLFKGYTPITPSYLSQLYSSASTPSKQYLPPAQPKPMGYFPQMQQPQMAPQKQKGSGLIAAPSNIASAIEEMFKTSLNPVSKFRRPLYSDATKALSNFYKKFIN